MITNRVILSTALIAVTTSFNTMAASNIESLVEKVRSNVVGEIAKMQEITGVPDSDPDVAALKKVLVDLTEQVKTLYADGKINPFVNLTTEGRTQVDPKTQNRLRIGYFPVAADPFHWAHLFTALEALVKLKLDKVVFIVQGHDSRKPNLTQPKIRHPMAKKNIELFGALFAFSDITTLEDSNDPNNPLKKSNNGENDGETNMFHDLQRNDYLPIDAFYLVGSDHFNWTVKSNGQERADTLKKLTDNMDLPNLGFKRDGNHTIQAAFIARDASQITDKKLENMKRKVNFDISVVIPSFSYSSTQIRNALKGQSDEGKKPLVMLPASTYETIMEKGLYQK